ncbi:MAG TPA: adenylate/guanylate cyclase domain-containing protein, partial [Spirochaetia bacterium]|nr:adenylate/guanylate cyclase domain-containing protein [Spirochaetia bacterium]
MSTLIDRVFGQKIKGVRVVPLVLKIVTIFTVLLLVSNFISNYINLMLNRGEELKLGSQLLVKDLKELSIFAMNQYQIYQFNNDYKGAIESIKQSASKELTRPKSLALGMKVDGSVVFSASQTLDVTHFTDQSALAMLEKASTSNTPEGSILFTWNGNRFFGVYKYNDKWDMYLIRAEELGEFYADSWAIFRQTSYIIVALTLVC